MLNAVIWLVIAITMFVVDILTSNFCFVLLSIGAVLAAICAAFDLSLIVQIIVFLLANIVSVSIGYPIIKKRLKKDFKRTPLMEETYIGKIMISDRDILKTSQIKLGGDYWTVINESEPIKCGDKFEIIGIEGIKLKIRKYREA